MVSINNISYYIGGRALFEEASLHIKPKDKIGLIGLNGKGKTTLLKIIHDNQKVDKGSISFSNDCTIGFLNQDLLSYKSTKSILHVAMEAFGEAVKIQDEIDEIIHALETEYREELIDKLTAHQEEFDRLGGYTMQARAEEILEGIGFSTEDLQRPLQEFSGGWRMRVMLAKLLLEKPSLLMLDEPTNHLDLPSIEWVENYLKSYDGAVITVSHDRNFLNNTINKIVEIDATKFNIYEGDYQFYLTEKELRREIQNNTYKNQQQQIRQTERFIERFRSKATKARQVQSRVKSLDRMEMVDEVADDNPSINFRFSLKTRSGKDVIQLKNISKSYDENVIFKNTSANIIRGEKIALIGANGKGKSTLLRIIAGDEACEGERNIGHNVNFGFYAQHQLEALHINNEILDELKQAGSGKSEQELRNVLGCFLFSDDDVFKKIKVLSGGEKSRVALAKTLISEANFLLLDEPTNHLDFISENILIQAIQQYEGTCIIISHNRHFIKNTATKIWYIEDYQLKEYPGTLDEYLYWSSNLKQDKKPVSQGSPKQEKTKKTKEGKPKKETTEIEKEINALEKDIMQLESQKSDLEKKLSSEEISGDTDQLEKLYSQYNKVSKEVSLASERWEKLIEKLEQN